MLNCTEGPEIASEEDYDNLSNIHSIGITAPADQGPDEGQREEE